MGINDNPPMFPPEAYIPLSEDVLADTLFHYVAATDQDVGDTAVITYEIDYAWVANQEGSALNNINVKDHYLSTDSNTGVLTLLRQFDRKSTDTTLLTQFIALQPPLALA